MEEELESQTIEPMLDAFCGYANDTLALILSPITLLLIVLFNKETQMPTNYGMTSSDLLIFFCSAVSSLLGNSVRMVFVTHPHL
ncbi:hypothetical protein BVRB_036390 [Beta vulgaris subsp. vulgaris]|uniref:Uncharacterized protein n=1 Tax=Beta vulgaris subsp. vulgaris TaxID=3555 RepID=A0A0J7YQI8_BETVV|nr:hypothetical protein BVRB_036390 [Beta vulgaris subsp. vulgaris]